MPSWGGLGASCRHVVSYLEPCWAILSDHGGHLGLSEAALEPSLAILGALTPRDRARPGPGNLLELSWAASEACRTTLAALVAFLGRLGCFGEPRGGAMAGQGPVGVGVVQSTGRCRRTGEGEGGVPEKTTETLPGSTWHSSTPRLTPPPQRCRKEDEYGNSAIPTIGLTRTVRELDLWNVGPHCRGIFERLCMLFVFVVSAGRWRSPEVSGGSSIQLEVAHWRLQRGSCAELHPIFWCHMFCCF